jgi:hypothetical protein
MNFWTRVGIGHINMEVRFKISLEKWEPAVIGQKKNLLLKIQ